jgi:hypothetical protein
VGREKSKAGKFAALPAADKWLVLRAVFWLGVARLRLAVTPFNKLAEQLSSRTTETTGEADPELVRRIGFAINAAANNVPWRSDCWPKAIAARSLLRRAGYASTIHLGVEKDRKGDLAGHAWLTCGDTVVTGGEDIDRYTEMHRFSV